MKEGKIVKLSHNDFPGTGADAFSRNESSPSGNTRTIIAPILDAATNTLTELSQVVHGSDDELAGLRASEETTHYYIRRERSQDKGQEVRIMKTNAHPPPGGPDHGGHVVTGS